MDSNINDIFKNLKYYLIGHVDEKIEKLLNSGGGKRDHYLSEMIDYVIVDDVTDPEYGEAKELFERPCVTTRWVGLSVRCGCLLPTNAFSPEVDLPFCGFTICPAQLCRDDVKKLWALVTYNGGQFQLAFNDHVTHLVTTTQSGSKQALATRHQVHIVTPDWVSDSVAEGAPLPENIYHPRLVLSDPADITEEPAMDITSDLSGFEPLEGSATKDSSKNAKTKEALAAMVSTRIMQSWKAPELEPLPLPLPASSVGGAFPSPGFPQLPGASPCGPRAMLRNITNSDGMPIVRPLRGRGSRGPRSPRSPRIRGPGRTPKMNQLVGLGFPGPHQFAGSPGFASPLSAGHAPYNMASALGTMLAPPAAPPPPQAIYLGHDPLDSVPEVLCLLGCVFYVTDYDKYQQQGCPDMLKTWRLVIEQHGGEMDDSYSNRVTHLLCEHQHSDVFQLAVKDGKRLVTAHWLNDVLLKKRLLPPCHAMHLPNVYGPDKPCKDQIIAVTNFEGEERTRIKNMITVIGAKYTGYFTAANSVLISKQSGGKKFEKANEWKIPVVNVGWLQDILLGDLTPLKLPVNPKYLTINPADTHKLELYKVARFMEGWKTPIRVSKEAWKKFQESKLLKANGEDSSKIKSEAETAGEQPGAKKPRLEEVDENVPPGSVPPHTHVLLLTGLPKRQATALRQEAQRLGARVTSTARAATHLVANQVCRTVKFLTAISCVQHVVTSDWITQSATKDSFLDESDFALVDSKSESEYNFSLKESLERARKHKLFKGMTFYKTPGVQPAGPTLEEVIASAGGVLVARRPSLRHIREKRDDHGRPTFHVISCQEDLYMVTDLTKRDIAVHSAEFVLTGVMRQEVDLLTFRLN